jgi:hypothetical protein
MKSHQFTVIVEGADLQAEEAANALFEAGCDDAMIGAVDGIQYLDFDREADSFEVAVITAVTEIERAVPGVRVVRIANAGLVSMADIAKRLGRTRESVRLLVSGGRGPGGFPPPVTDPRSRYRLWRWSEVAEWMRTELAEEVSDSRGPVESAINAMLDGRATVARLSSQQRRVLQTLVES